MYELTDKELKSLFRQFIKDWSDAEWSDYKYHVIIYLDTVKSLYGIDSQKYKNVERIWKTMIEVQEEE